MEEIRFTKQSNRAIDACLVSQEQNHGVVVKYWLPPLVSTIQRNSQDDVKPTMKVETKTGSDKDGDSEETENEDEEEEEEGESSTSDSENSKDDEDPEVDNYERQMENSDGSSCPNWINDLKNIMKLWQQQMDGMDTELLKGLKEAAEGRKKLTKGLKEANAKIKVLDTGELQEACWVG